jgi:lysine 2,3-aminomutase
MKATRVRKQLHDVFDSAPELKEILLSPEPIDVKRKKIRRFLSEMIDATFEHDPKIPPLEWLVTRNAVRAFRRMLSLRSEQLARFSLLQYLDDLFNERDTDDLEVPSPAFLAEIEHLVRGVTGRSGIYSDKIPAFLKYRGTKAARLRSEDLSSMARTASSYMERYPYGLDDAVVRRREANRRRILENLGATDDDWQNWKWHMRHVVRNAETLRSLVGLTDEEFRAVELARIYRIPFGITPYYLSLMDDAPGTGNDAGVRAQVIPPLDYIEKISELRQQGDAPGDFMLERDTSPIEGVTRRYPRIAILKPVLTCPQICVYCQRNWEIQDISSSQAVLPREILDNAIDWIANTPEIDEVLVTGGDPLMLSDRRISEILARLSEIRHVERIRIGTRTPVTLPQRITDSLSRIISSFHEPGKREVVIVTHFEHSYELTPEAMEACQRLRRCGISILNQLVYTFYNSRKFEAAALRHKLRLIGVSPYYTFNTKGKNETDDYRVPVSRLLQERKEEARLMPGTVRTDEYIFNVPGLGKNSIASSQHHDVISILPDGRRVYEFHPWEKKLSLVDTYIYTDVPIHDYLQRLRTIGEDLEDYKTIWYYY